jgi:2'-5' RNA ligase
MPPLQYALVTYVKNELGRFVEELRREIHPALGHLPAHMSILPPRTLRGSEEQALATLGRLCQSVAPFEVTLGGVGSFHPVTPTVYLSVETSSLMDALHDRLNTEALAYTEQWPYVSHLTIVKLEDESRVPAVLELARERWSAYRGSRQARVEELTFVREGATASHWMDLAPVPLGRALASKTRD